MQFKVTQKLMSLKSKTSQLKHMATKSKIFMWIQSHTKINTAEVLKKASNEQNSCNVQSKDLT